MKFTESSREDFCTALAYAQSADDKVREATTPAEDLWSAEGEMACFLSEDGRSGYAVKDDGELVGVFSTVKGRGNALLHAALDAGACRLDCFDGYLPTLYAQHGFRETGRAKNWHVGGPDVVFMERG